MTDRMGHKSSAMVARYRRRARQAEELKLGVFSPLYVAIPELAGMNTAEPNPPTQGKLLRLPIRGRRGGMVVTKVGER